ncbi:MAG: ATP-binding protein [Bacteroidales bacterium]|nr:ATP-binding protein [Bacteroidales bacterium]MDT8373658.1 ATP-binding protein [Bacteroidales bacterium]
MIVRFLQKKIEEKLDQGKAIIISGARQTGKTTLLKLMFSGLDGSLWLNGDEPDVRALFDEPSSTRFKALFGNSRMVIIDEAQRIKDIGLKLKLITDQIPEVQLVVTGSSSFDLANKINEPLTGRKWEYNLFPLSFAEMAGHHGFLNEKRLLFHRLVYGYYPEVVNSPGQEKELLKQLSDSYLYKDILMLGDIRKPEKLVRLLQLLAFQVGNEVSYNELGMNLDLDNQTVEKYIQLLEKTYVIFRLGSFSRNLRKELKRARKIYFYDNGIRNTLIANFNPPELRNDTGPLWENFLISERQKHIHYSGIWANRYFWRTHDQQEIDYIEERDSQLWAYEFKWKPGKKLSMPVAFTESYPGSPGTVITPDNFEDLLL